MFALLALIPGVEKAHVSRVFGRVCRTLPSLCLHRVTLSTSTL
jgi:hypothetical protein